MATYVASYLFCYVSCPEVSNSYPLCCFGGKPVQNSRCTCLYRSQSRRLYGLWASKTGGCANCAAGACKVLLKRGSCILMYALVTIDPSRTGKLRAVFGNPSCSVLTRGKAARSATSDDSRSRNVVKRYSLPLTIIPPIHRCQWKRRSKVLRVI